MTDDETKEHEEEKEPVVDPDAPIALDDEEEDTPHVPDRLDSDFLDPEAEVVATKKKKPVIIDDEETEEEEEDHMPDEEEYDDVHDY